MPSSSHKRPHHLVAIVPLVSLIAMLSIAIMLFGNDTLNGPSQICLFFSTVLCIGIGMLVYHVSWKTFEDKIVENMSGVFATLLILFAVGLLGGTWMVSGVVPTIIYYGIQMLSPRFFLVSACVICALVSLLSGSSWTTIATLGVAMIAIGNALGVSEAWTAGAIISGAYFGDKMSPLSDTTILASSVTRVDLFTHIHYMTITTTPALIISLVIFFVAGLGFDGEAPNVTAFTSGLAATYNISLWTLLVPLLTGVLIIRRVPSLIVLVASGAIAGVLALILQPHVLAAIGGGDAIGHTAAVTRGLAMSFFGHTEIETGNAALNALVTTRGMAGMLNTVWLIIFAMCFGAAMVASGMLESITQRIIALVRTRLGLVASTVANALLFNITAGDQYISIMLTGETFRDTYRRMGFEGRLLSRTTEDSATVTSVLVPWNSCGMTQSTVLGVPTLTYLPYCFFNLLCPVMTLLVATIGWRIVRNDPADTTTDNDTQSVPDA